VAGRIRSLEKSNDLILNRTSNLQACSIVRIKIANIDVIVYIREKINPHA
jgi:hypothetical protein